jgi:hypothetical protein
MVAVAAAMAAAACGPGTTTAAGRTPSQPPPSSASSRSAPNPFTVVARYSAASLGLKEPRDLAIGPDGNLYVTDGTADRVTVVSPSGKVVGRWGGRGKGPGEFHFVSHDTLDPSYHDASLAVGPDGDVYVSDSGNERVEVFSPTGRFLRQFGSDYFGNGHFLSPFDLAVDPAGNVYVADVKLIALQKYSPAGRFLWQIGGPTSTDPDLGGNGEYDLSSVDDHGRVVMTNDTQEAVLYIDGSGHKVDVFHTTGDFPVSGVGPCGAMVDAAGDTFVLSCGAGYATGCGGSRVTRCTDHFALVYDRSHRLIGAWYRSPFALPPRFGPNGEVFTLGAGGSILKLKVALP